MTVRVTLPYHLQPLARTGSEVTLDVEGVVTPRAIIDALEARYPMLRGTVRDHTTGQRQPYLRFFVCKEDVSLEDPDTPLPGDVATGKEPFIILGSIAGG